jgi:hypothetical protein
MAHSGKYGTLIKYRRKYKDTYCTLDFGIQGLDKGALVCLYGNLKEYKKNIKVLDIVADNIIDIELLNVDEDCEPILEDLGWTVYPDNCKLEIMGLERAVFKTVEAIIMVGTLVS